MPEFKTGDRVKRVTENFLNAKVGQVYTVEQTNGSHSLTLKEIQGIYDENCFVLVGKEPKPWLKVTPPQPEKRELVNFWPNSECKIIFSKACDDTDLAKVFCNELHAKDIRELGEALIEISKEMK